MGRYKEKGFQAKFSTGIHPLDAGYGALRHPGASRNPPSPSSAKGVGGIFEATSSEDRDPLRAGSSRGKPIIYLIGSPGLRFNEKWLPGCRGAVQVRERKKPLPFFLLTCLP